MNERNPLTYYSFPNITELHRCANRASYEVGAFARAILKGRAWSVTPRALKQAPFIAMRDLIGLPMKGRKENSHEPHNPPRHTPADGDPGTHKKTVSTAIHSPASPPFWIQSNGSYDAHKRPETAWPASRSPID